MRWSRPIATCTCAAAVLMAAVPAWPATAAPTTQAERLHARAVQAFREGRFPEAYGRFVGLANAGHPASARYALWMCEQGPALFGSLWDCAPHEQEDWARLAVKPQPAPPDLAVSSFRRLRPAAR